jgi:acetyltransferase-like isoleucine patch superfamily enzyme
MSSQESVSIHPTAIVEEDVYLGPGVKIWHHCHIRRGAHIGAGTSLGKNVFVDVGVKIGSGVKIQNNVSVYSGVTIEEDVFVGPSVVFTNDLYPRAFGEWSAEEALPTLIKKGASLGANSCVLCGNTIGEYAMVAMGSVVLADVGNFELWAGNPAAFVHKVNRLGKRQK